MLTARGNSVAARDVLAELHPQPWGTSIGPESVGLPLERDFALFSELYRRQPWVRAVVDKRAEAVSRLPISVWRTDGDARVIDTESPYAKLIAKPNPRMTPFMFWGWLQRMVDVYGEAFMYIARDGDGLPESLHPMHPSRVSVRRLDDGTRRYFFQSGGGVIGDIASFPESDVIPFLLFNPNRTERGLSKLEALCSTLFAEDAQRRALEQMHQNGARPNLVVTTQRVLGDAGRKRLRAAFDESHAGSANAGKTLILEEGLTAVPLQISARDLEAIDMRKLNREEICAVFDIAPPMVGILEFATYSNIESQLMSFWRDAMTPPIRFIEGVLDMHLAGDGQQVSFGLEDVARGDFETRMTAAHAGFTSGLLTVNEAREMLGGLQPLADPQADRLFANAAMQPLGSTPT